MLKNINKNWKFLLDDEPEAFQKGFQDEAWTDVTLPHDWSVTGDFSKKYSSGTGYLPGGTAWYRGHFCLPEELKNKKIWVVFDGVYKNSQVWCNSYYLGKRAFGYATFRYDITDFIKFGEDNVLSVKVSHKDISDSRWFTGSGITRKVTLDVQDKIHFDEYGIVFSSDIEKSGDADIEVKNYVVNETNEDINITVKNTLVDVDNKALNMEAELCLAPNERKTAVCRGTVSSPRLWSSDLPNLYKLTAAIEHGGEMLSTQEIAVGICKMEFHSDKGFFINGKCEKLKGVCLHHDAGCLGAAVHKKVWHRRLKKLKEMGCNAIRMSHNPHMPELYDLCDEMGFYVIDEAFDEWEGCKNKWSTGHNVYPPKHQGYAEDFPQWHEVDLRMLIKRGRNHPSILMWSIGNEIDYPNDPYCHPKFTSMVGNNDKDKPASEMMYSSDKPNMERLTTVAKRLAAIVKEEDSTRPVTAAVAFPELSSYLGYLEPLDVIGYNYKEEYYKQDHGRFPDKPFLGSENGHSMQAWKAVRDCDYISGQFLWTGIDFLGEAQGWPIHGSKAGLLTLAGYEKANYWFRQALWSSNPICRIVTARADCINTNDIWGETTFDCMWNYSPKEKIEVRCFTNTGGAELFLNGKSLGKAVTNDETGFCNWTVEYEEGIISAVSNHSDIECSIETTNTAIAVILNPYENTFTSDGEDIVQIEVSVVDNNRRTVLTDASMLRVQVDGGTLIGIESGNLADNTSYAEPERRAYKGRAIIYARSEVDSSKITVKVSSDNLKGAEIAIESEEIIQ